MTSGPMSDTRGTVATVQYIIQIRNSYGCAIVSDGAFTYGETRPWRLTYSKYARTYVRMHVCTVRTYVLEAQ